MSRLVANLTGQPVDSVTLHRRVLSPWLALTPGECKTAHPGAPRCADVIGVFARIAPLVFAHGRRPRGPPAEWLSTPGPHACPAASGGERRELGDPEPRPERTRRRVPATEPVDTRPGRSRRRAQVDARQPAGERVAGQPWAREHPVHRHRTRGDVPAGVVGVVLAHLCGRDAPRSDDDVPEAWGETLDLGRHSLRHVERRPVRVVSTVVGSLSSTIGCAACRPAATAASAAAICARLPPTWTVPASATSGRVHGTGPESTKSTFAAALPYGNRANDLAVRTGRRRPSTRTSVRGVVSNR